MLSLFQRQREFSHHPIDMEEVISCCLESVTRGLSQRGSGGERRFQTQPRSFTTIFRIPEGRRGINSEAVEPQVVAIGPYHRGQARLSDFEEHHKWHFLQSFLHRGPERLEDPDAELERLIRSVANEAQSAWDRYSEPGMPFDCNFMQMMILDGCFVVELVLQICRKIEDETKNSEFELIRTWGEQEIHQTIGDLLKLENQVPYSLLQSIYGCKRSTRVGPRVPSFDVACLKVFDLAYPKLEHQLPDLHYWQYYRVRYREYNHLLDLFHYALVSVNMVHHCVAPPYRPSEKSIPCVTQLRPCGIKFKSKKTKRFLEISFEKRVLEIPYIAINDFMITVLINFIALEQCQERSFKEQCQERSFKHVTDYVSFMRCLINEPKDVSLLCSDKIILASSHDDPYVVNLFNGLAKGIVFNVENCYLSEQFEKLESYYSNWGIMIRTYFSSPWAAISVLSAFLIIALTATQTFFAVVGHYSR